MSWGGHVPDSGNSMPESPQARMSSMCLRTWHTERAGERSREDVAEVDGVWSAQGLVGQGAPSGVYSCYNTKLSEGFL